MRKDIMVDIETLGTGVESTIFQISAISFNINTGEYYSVFDGIANIEDNHQLKVDGSTLKWWLNTDKELLTSLLNLGKGSSRELLERFHSWLLSQSEDMRDVYLWGNGILFDNKMIQYQLESIGLDYPIFYRNDRDVRTVIDITSAKLGISEDELKGEYINDSLVKHDAMDDVEYQISLLVGCYNELLNK